MRRTPLPFLTGWPTDVGDGSVSTEARWRKMAQLWAPSGVVDGYLDRLDPDYSLGTVTVGAGAAWIDGHYCRTAHLELGVRSPPTAWW